MLLCTLVWATSNTRIDIKHPEKIDPALAHQLDASSPQSLSPIRQLLPAKADDAPYIQIILLLADQQPPYENQDDIIQQIQFMGGNAWGLHFINAIIAEVPRSKAAITYLASLPKIAEIQASRPGSSELDANAEILGLTQDKQFNPNSFWAHGITGKSAAIGILDSGIATEHPHLAEKSIEINRGQYSGFTHYPNGVRTAHGTGVACIFSSTDPQYRGISFGVTQLVSALAGDKESEGDDYKGIALSLRSLDWMLTRAQHRPNIINYSFGNGEAGDEDAPDWSLMAKIVDFVVNRYGVLWVKSAGNAGWLVPQQEGNRHRSTLTTPADNYNGLTVANMLTVRRKDSLFKIFEKETDRTKQAIAPRSSRGPTVSGRKKPDITAPGSDTRTCAPDPNQYVSDQNPMFKAYTPHMFYQPDSGTRLMGGTSAAAPHVGAAAALLYDAGIHQPMAIKAILINSADAWTDNHSPGPFDDAHTCAEPMKNCGHHPVAGSHWNPSYGWGYLNLETAYRQIDSLKQGKLSKTHPTETYQLMLSPDDKVTLVHERRVGFHTKTGRPLPLTPITLQIIDPQTKKILAQDPSEIDTVHQVSLPPSQPAGLYLVKVALTHPKDTIAGSDNEPFALAHALP